MSETRRITVAAIETAPSCSSIGDFYAYPARRTLSRLFKNYVAAVGATPIETLHSATEMKRVMDAGDLVNTAVFRVASLQAKGDQARSKELRERLFGLGEALAERARGAEDKVLPALDTAGYDALAEAAAALSTDPAEQGFLIRVGISRQITKSRIGWDKLESLIGWAEKAQSADIAPLDDFFTDLLSDIKFIEQLPGSRPNLAGSLQFLAAVAFGNARYGEGQGDAANGRLVERLSKLIADGRLPDAQIAIADRISQQLALKTPLSKNKPGDEDREFYSLADRLVPIDRPMVGGHLVSEGLVRRLALMINKSGPGGLKDATDQLCGAFVDIGRRARFLLALHESAIRADVSEVLTNKLRDAIKGLRALDDHDRSHAGFEERLRRVTGLHRLIQQSDLPTLSKVELNTHLENLLLASFKDEDLARIEGKTSTLLERATRLIALCLPEQLPPGSKAVEQARTRILARLKQPNFETALISHLSDPDEIAAAHRDFFQLMKRAGFL